ncbi:MAG: hypothetical protein IJR55_05825 [Clostridia bacterium]|nr:hypothetical protein [Clostridia bacterium]
MREICDEIMEKMRSTENEKEFCSCLYKYILNRLELPDDTKETDIYYLVLYSVRIKMPDEDIKTLESRLATVDCHQTSYIVSKKTLLMMETERKLGVALSADDATNVKSTTEYAELLWRAKNV